MKFRWIFLILILFQFIIPAYSYAYCFWIGEKKNEIENDTNFVKISEERDQYGFLTSKYARSGSDYIYKFIFNDNDFVIGTQLNIINKELAENSKNSLKPELILKDIPYARFLRIKKIIKDCTENEAQKMGMGIDAVQIKDEDYEMLEFFVEDKFIMSLSISDKQLSLATPELKSLAEKRVEQNIRLNP